MYMRYKAVKKELKNTVKRICQVTSLVEQPIIIITKFERTRM